MVAKLRALNEAFQDQVRDLLAVGAALSVIVGSVVALLVGRVDLGLSMAVVGDRVVIQHVEPGSPASREGFRAGMVVLRVNGVEMLRLAEPEQPEEPSGIATPEPSTGPSPVPTAAPTNGPGAASASPDPSGTVGPGPTTDAGPGAGSAAATNAPVASATPPGSIASSSSDPAASGHPASPSPAAVAPVPDASPSARPRGPVILAIDPRVLDLVPREPIRQLSATFISDVDSYFGGEPFVFTYLGRDYVGELESSAYLLLAGLAVLLGGGWLLATGRAGAGLRPLAVPLAAAAALPLLARPLEATWTASAATLAAVAVPFGIAPLGFALANRVEGAEARRIAWSAAIGGASLAMLLGIGRANWTGASGRASDAGIVASDLTWMALTTSAALIPGLMAGLRRPRPVEASAPSNRVVQSNELALAGATPFMSLATGISSLPLFLPLSGWLAAIVVAGRWTVRPLLRVAARATLQRDLVVAATEAERARVAAEIHDDALQELTLLVRRLDESGDSEGAEIARTVSERLRAITGDLRLPILDDLGVGPALDWLAQRMERLSGGPVRLERVGDARLPPDVELAFFRIAQEALGNAVKHGKGPITIRFHATGASASLAVDDAGPGIDLDIADQAEGSGRFGILNMRQRAEQIGALLDIRSWPAGGTHVALEWRAK